jgi:predicted RNA-binding protein YlqC (UPF0109 family)
LINKVRLALKSRFSTIGTEVTVVRELVEIMVKALVDNPDQVSITEIPSESALIIELKVAKEDIGKIIGKKGRNVQAMRTILNAAAAKVRKRVILEIIE